MEALVGLIILWGVVLVILLLVLLVSIHSLTRSLSDMNETVERLSKTLESGKPLPSAKEEQPAQKTEEAATSAEETATPAAETAPLPSDVAQPNPPFVAPPPLPPTPTAEAAEQAEPPVSANAIYNIEEPVVAAKESEATDEESIPLAAPKQAEEPPETPQEEPPAEPEVIEPREPTMLQKRMRMLKNWFVYGRAEGVGEGEAAEKLLATTWLLRCGILVILFTSAFLLKLSIDKGILAPSGRVALSYIAGAGLLLAGLSKRMRERYWSMGQALCGISLGVFYFSSFAMTSMYHLVSATVGGAVMCITTVTAGFLADRLNSISVAMVAMIGGYATPLLLNTGAKNFPGLSAYLVLLGIGVLWLAYRRNWLQLNWLAMLFTYGIFALAINAHYEEADFAVCQIGLVLFFVLFSTSVFVHNVRKSVPATALEIFGLLGNSALFFGLSWYIIDTVNHGDRLFFAPLTLGLAAYYLLHAVVLGRRRDESLRGLLLIFCALSGFYLALTFPVVLSGEWLAAAWAMQAFMMLWLGHRMDSRLLKNCAWILYAITLGHLAFHEFWLYDGMEHSPDGTFWSGVVSRIFQYLLPVASMAAAAHLTMKANAAKAEAEPAAPEAEIAENAPLIAMPRTRGEILSGVLFGLAFIVLFLFLRLEIATDLHGLGTYRLTGINIVWIGGCLVALMLLRKGFPGWWQLFLAILLGGTLLRVVIDFFDKGTWRWGAPNLPSYMLQFEWTYCIGGLLNTLVLVLGIMFCGRLMPKGKLERAMSMTCRIAWPILLFVHSTREWGMIIKYKLPGLTGGGISVLWAIFAFVLVFRGLTKSIRSLRYIGLALFAVVVCKVFLFDMRHLEAIYRVLAFFAFGVLLMGAAFVYLKFWRNSNWSAKEEQ